MWRNIFRPEVLFTFATLQALSPYLFWQLGWSVSWSHDNLTYYPVPIWLGGCICFAVGSRLVARKLPATAQYSMLGSEGRIRTLVISLMLLVLIQAVLITAMYGTVPILSYLKQDGRIDIAAANQAQESSAVGQVGLYDVSLSWLNGGIMLLLILLYERRKKVTPLAITTLVFIVLFNLINGRRQGLVRSVIYIMCGLALYSNNLRGALAQLFPLPKNRLVLAAIAIVVISASVYGFGYIAYIRNQGIYSRDGVEEITAYQEYPLLNFEQQCRDAGFGPFQFNFFYPFQRLLPYKLIQNFAFAQMDPPVRVEPSSPAGFYEDVQWAMGPLGIIGLPLVIGMLSTYFYSRSLHSPPHLLIYCQMAFNLFISHSFNEFLILAYFPGVLTVFLLCAPLKFEKMRGRPSILLLRRKVHESA